MKHESKRTILIADMGASPAVLTNVGKMWVGNVRSTERI